MNKKVLFGLLGVLAVLALVVFYFKSPQSKTAGLQGTASTGQDSGDIIHYGDILNLKSLKWGNYATTNGGDAVQLTNSSILFSSEEWKIVDAFDAPRPNKVLRFGQGFYLYSKGKESWLTQSGFGNNTKLNLAPKSAMIFRFINAENPGSNAVIRSTDIVLIRSDWRGKYFSATGSQSKSPVALTDNTAESEKWSIAEKDFLRNWMANTPEIKNKRLKEITFPATHDSGTASFENRIEPSEEAQMKEKVFKQVEDIFKSGDVIHTLKLDDIKVNKINELTQNVTYKIIEDLGRCTKRDLIWQLNEGIRWFDLRIYTEKQYSGAPTFSFTHHALVGEFLDTRLGQIKGFLANTKGEIVVLEMSHFRGDYTKDFLNKLKSTLGPYAYKKELDAGGNVTNNPLEKTYTEVVGENPASKVILLVSEDTASDEMLWTYKQLGIRNGNDDPKSPYSYANKTDAEAMYTDQLEKYEKAKAAGDPFTLWYTLTGQEDDMPTIVLGRMPVELTEVLAPQVVNWIMGENQHKLGESEARKALEDLIRGPLKQAIKDGLGVDKFPYISVKELSEKVNPDMQAVLEKRFQSSAEGTNHITVLYNDFYENSALVGMAIRYSRMPAAQN